MARKKYLLEITTFSVFGIPLTILGILLIINGFQIKFAHSYTGTIVGVDATAEHYQVDVEGYKDKEVTVFSICIVAHHTQGCKPVRSVGDKVNVKIDKAGDAEFTGFTGEGFQEIELGLTVGVIGALCIDSGIKYIRLRYKS